MMRRRTILAIGGTGAAAVAAAILLAPAGERPGRFTPGALAFPDLAPRLAQAARVELIRHTERTTLLRVGEGWGVEQLSNYPARLPKLREMLAALTELRLMEERTSDPALHARLGVDDPATAGSTATRLRMQDAQGAVILDTLLGTRRARAQGQAPDTVFLRREGEAQSWLAEGRVVPDAEPSLWVDREVAMLAPDRLRRVEVQRAGEAPLTLERAGEVDAPLRVVAPAEAPATAPAALEDVGRAFDLLTFTNVRPATALEGEALGQARFTYTDDLVITAWPRKLDGQLWVVLRADGGPEAQALHARWQGWAYQLGEWKEKALIPRLEDLLAP
jgi:hypothetical protein